MGRSEARYYGRAACRAILRRRAPDVLRLFLDRSLVSDWSRELREMAGHRRAYRLVGEQDLQSLSRSQHHEGVVLDATPPPKPSVAACLPLEAGTQVVALDHVANPHNLGAICRSAAHFGATALMARSGPPFLQGAAARVAEGGAESVLYGATEQMVPVLEFGRQRDYQIWVLSSDGVPLFRSSPPERVLWVVGHEREGVSQALRACAHRIVAIPGTGAVESLNASVAAAVAMSWYVGRFGHEAR